MSFCLKSFYRFPFLLKSKLPKRRWMAWCLPAPSYPSPLYHHTPGGVLASPRALSFLCICTSASLHVERASPGSLLGLLSSFRFQLTSLPRKAVLATLAQWAAPPTCTLSHPSVLCSSHHWSQFIIILFLSFPLVLSSPIWVLAQGPSLCCLLMRLSPVSSRDKHTTGGQYMYLWNERISHYMDMSLQHSRWLWSWVWFHSLECKQESFLNAPSVYLAEYCAYHRPAREFWTDP